MGLNKDFISWVWRLNLKTQIKTGNQSTVQLDNRLQSSLFRQSNRVDKWRDENTFALAWQLPINDVFSTGTIIESRIYSDENAQREFNKHLLAQEFKVKISPNISLKPALGATLEKSFDTADEGWYAKLGVKVNKQQMSDYLNYTDLQSEIRAFPDRKNQDHSFYTGWTRQFSDFASDSLQIGYEFSENRYYLPNQNGFSTQEQIIINSRFLFNQLQYRLSNRSFFAFLTTFRNRDIDQSTFFSETNEQLNRRRRDEFNLENQAQFFMLLGKWRMKNSLFFSQLQNDNPNVDTDISTLQTALNTELQYSDGRNSLLGKISYTKLEYNTPTEETSVENFRNRQDRDEIRFIFDLDYKRKLSSYFTIGFSGNTYLFHQIYLRSGRSQNNNWNRIFQVGTSFLHKISERVQHGQSIKILANYTTFDFEELLPQVRSYVFRKLVYSDSLRIDVSDNLSLITNYQWEKEDNGSFFQESFTQQVNRELSAHFVNINLRHKSILGLQFTTGVSIFLRDEWGFTPVRERRKTREYTTISPRLLIIYPAKKRLLVYVNYAPNRSKNRSRQIFADSFSENEQFIQTGSINLRYSF